MCSAALNYSRGLSAVRIGIGFRDKVRIRLKVRLTLVLALGTHCTALFSAALHLSLTIKYFVIKTE